MTVDKKAAIITGAIMLPLLAGGLWYVSQGDIGSVLQIAMIIMPIPVLITSLIIYKSFELVRARKWMETSARITKAEMRQEHHKGMEDVSTVVNVPRVEYEFSINGEKYHGSRISLAEPKGTASDDSATVALERYKVGRSMPVYYDPANPMDSVLERDAPVSLGCMFTGAAILMAGGFALVAGIFRGAELQDKLGTYMPKGAHPIFVVFFAFSGVFILLILLAQRRQAVAARHWLIAQGRVVSSKTESYRSYSGSSRSRTATTFYEPVVEYSFNVDGSEYHSTQLRFGGKVATGSKARADAKAAQFPVGNMVEVHYDPQNPSNAVLEIKIAFGWLWLVIAAICFVLAALFGNYLHR